MTSGLHRNFVVCGIEQPSKLSVDLLILNLTIGVPQFGFVDLRECCSPVCMTDDDVQPWP